MEKGDAMTTVTNDVLKATPERADSCPVAVICITYNQEDYIREALDSFLMQETSFPYKILVSDDHSTDRTPEIITEYAEKYPQIIPILRTENNGGPKNLRLTCQAAHTKYVALCEGDDYWTDPLKLQKQYDFMEAHEEYNACFCDTEIIADDDWYLNDYYKRDEQGRMLIPRGIPGITSFRDDYSVLEYLNAGIQAHTSTLFYRWREDLEFLPAYDELFAGDNALFMMVVANEKAAYLQEVVSAYRKTNDNQSAIAFREWRENALKVQKSWLDVCSYLAQWFSRYAYDPAILAAIGNRSKLAAHHYLLQLIKEQDSEAVSQFFMDYPRQGVEALEAYLSFYRDGRALTAAWGWENYKRFVRHPNKRKYLKRFQPPYLAGEKAKEIIQNAIREVGYFAGYWANSLSPKDPNQWVVTSFRHVGYLDNSRYLYEYVTANEPDIKITWVTSSPDVYKQLASEGMPVEMMDSKKGKEAIKRAALAVTDHFKSSDYTYSTFNHATQVAQLWHGSGIKGMKNLGNTRERGVVYSADIIPQKGDLGVVRLGKAVKRFFVEPYREMHEQYLLIEVSNPQDVVNAGSDWHISPEHFFVNGSPRNGLLEKVANGYVTDEMKQLKLEKPDVKYRVIYAPTYRYDQEREHRMMQDLCDSLPMIDACMKELDGEFVIRLHPHTWRSYSSDMRWAMKGLDHIRIDEEEDIYATLGIYDLLISDYSSIATDFMLFDRPMVFFRPDHQEFLEEENDLRYDPDKYNPGPKTSTWAETLDAIRAYHADPSIDGEWRREICEEVFPSECNDENNAKRLVAEIRRRLRNK